MQKACLCGHADCARAARETHATLHRIGAKWITEDVLTAWCTHLKVPLDSVLASRSHLRIASHHFLDKFFVTTWCVTALSCCLRSAPSPPLLTGGACAQSSGQHADACLHRRLAAGQGWHAAANDCNGDDTRGAGAEASGASCRGA